MAETEEKIYLVNVESNLDEYTKEAAKAADEVAKLTEENKALKASGTASTVEIEKSNAALRNAQGEYREAKKMVDLQTKANESNTNSRKQLAAIVTLEQQRLGKLSESYVINANGQRELSQEYITASERLKKAKDAMIAYDKAQSDGRSSIGLYSEALQGMTGNLAALPGPVGQAGSAVTGLGGTLKALLANPVVLIIAGIVAVFKLLYDAFKRTQENSIILNKAIGAVSGIFNTLMNTLKPVAEFIADKVVKVFDTLGKVAEKALGFVSKALNFLGFEKAAESVANWTESLKEGAKAGSDLAEAEIRLKNAQRDLDRISLEYLKKEEKLRQIRDDTSKSIDQRIKANKELADTLTAQANAEMVIAKQELAVADMRLKLQGESDENLDKRAEALKHIADIEEKITGFQSEQLTNANSLKKEAEDQLKAAKDKVNAELKAYKKQQEEYKKIDKKAIEDKKKLAETQAEWERNRQLSNQENLLSIRELYNDYIYNTERVRLEIQRKDDVANAEKTGADINIINAKWAAAQRQIDEAEATAKLGLYSDFAGNLATIFGQNTAIGMAAAIAQTTIATYTAAMEAYKSVVGVPVVGPVLAVVAAGAAVAAGIANIKKIVAVKSGLPGDSGGSAPTSLSASFPAQHYTASGANLFTQPQYTQSELNSAPNQGGLTNEGLVEAIKSIPPPIVTIEDINAKAAEKAKVEVRATI
jgi:hypothetical protein